MPETVFNEGSINGTDFRIESDTNANMFFIDGADDKIGIGTNDPAAIFDVQGSTGSNYVGSFINTSDTGWGLFVKGGSDNADYSLRIQDKDANDLLSVKGGGRIGIGTNDPQALTHIKGADTVVSGTYGEQLIIEDTAAYNAAQYAGISFKAQYHSNGSIAHIAQIVGDRPDTSNGTYNGQLYFLTRTSGSDLEKALTLDYNQNATFAGNITQSKAGNLRLTQTATGTGEASLHLHANNSTGDSFIRFQTDSNTFAMGFDNSDGDKFIISAGSDPHSNSVINIQPDGSSIAIDKITSVGQGFVFTGTALSTGHTGIGASGSGGDLRIYTNGLESWNFDSNGNLISKNQSNGKAHPLRFTGTASYANGAYTSHAMGASGAIVLITNHTADSSALFHMDYNTATITMIANPNGVGVNGFNNAGTGDCIRVTKSAGSFSFTVSNDVGATRSIGIGIISMHES